MSEQARARFVAHALLDGTRFRTIGGHRFSGHWWITTTGCLAVQDVTGATRHHDLDSDVAIEWDQP